MNTYGITRDINRSIRKYAMTNKDGGQTFLYTSIEDPIIDYYEYLKDSLNKESYFFSKTPIKYSFKPSSKNTYCQYLFDIPNVPNLNEEYFRHQYPEAFI